MQFQTTVPTATTEPKEEKSEFRLPRWNSRMTQEELMAFTHQMASTLGSGLSIGAALEVLMMPGVHRPTNQEMIKDLAVQVNDGQPLSAALSTRPDIFEELYVSLVEAGEVSAKLPEVLKRLANFEEKKMRLTRNIFGALLYPFFVLLFGIAVGTGMLAYGAPILEEMYHSAGATLPRFSAAIIAFGRLIGDFFWLFVAVGLLSIPFLRVLWSRPAFRRWLDHFLLTWNVTADLTQKSITARCARTLGVLYGNGIPILKSLELTGRAAGNIIYRELFVQTAQEVRDGSSVSAPLLSSPYFPAMAGGMLSAGEESGKLSEMLEHVAEHYESQVEFAVQALVKFLEPVLVILVGGFIGAIVIALGIPFMNLMSVIA